MRSTPPSRPSPHPHPSRQQLVDGVAHVVDSALGVEATTHLLIHVMEDSPDLVLGTRPIARGLHPFDVLAGFTAPTEWTAFGLRVHGVAHHLDATAPPEPTTTTFLVHRAGEERSLLRRGDAVEVLTEPARGTLADACRRVLGRPTAPPPPSTAGLWTVAWLHELLALCAAGPRRCGHPLTWSDLALVHPAVGTASDDDLLHLHDPTRFAVLGRAHSAAWPWTRLRTDPAVLHLPDGDLPPDVVAWMDDGFYARWALGAFPSAAALSRDLRDLLPAPLATTVLEAVAGLLS